MRLGTEASVWRSESNRLWCAYWKGEGKKRAYRISYSDDDGLTLRLMRTNGDDLVQPQTAAQDVEELLGGQVTIWGSTFQNVRTKGCHPNLIVSIATKDKRLYAASSANGFRIVPVSKSKLEKDEVFDLIPLPGSDGQTGFRAVSATVSFITHDGVEWEIEEI